MLSVSFQCETFGLQQKDAHASQCDWTAATFRQAVQLDKNSCISDDTLRSVSGTLLMMVCAEQSCE